MNKRSALAPTHGPHSGSSARSRGRPRGRPRPPGPRFPKGPGWQGLSRIHCCVPTEPTERRPLGRSLKQAGGPGVADCVQGPGSRELPASRGLSPAAAALRSVKGGSRTDRQRGGEADPPAAAAARRGLGRAAGTLSYYLFQDPLPAALPPPPPRAPWRSDFRRPWRGPRLILDDGSSSSPSRPEPLPWLCGVSQGQSQQVWVPAA